MNTVINQIPTENLFVLPITSRPMIHFDSDCKVTAMHLHYPLLIMCMYVLHYYYHTTMITKFCSNIHPQVVS